jgi:hypothetical protein
MGEGREYRRRRHPSLVGPVILITAGVLILLSMQGVLKINWLELWRFWPVLLILAGLEALLGRRSVVGNLIVLGLTLIIIAGVIWVVVKAPGTLGVVSYSNVDHISEPLSGTERAGLQVQFAAGQLKMEQLVDSSSLIEGTLKLATQNKPVWTIDRSGSQATMNLGYAQDQAFSAWATGDDWDLRLSPKVGFSLNVNAGAGTATLDLTGLDVRGLQVQAGVGDTTIILPANGNFTVSLRGGVGALTLKIPQGMAARLSIDRGLSALSISPRFQQSGSEYLTSDWTTNQNRADVQIQVGVGAVTVRDP